MLNMQTVCSSTFSGKTTKSLLSTVCWSGRLCSCLIMTFHGDVDSGMKWHQLRGFSPSPTAYIAATLLYKVRIWFPSSQERGGQILTLQKGRYEVSASILLNKFLAKILRLGAGREMAVLHQIRSWSHDLLHMVQRQLRNTPLHAYWHLCLNTPLLGLNPPLGEGGGWLGSPSCTHPHIRDFFFFASFSLITWHLAFFLDVNCS
jgi:hypothetical protein